MTSPHIMALDPFARAAHLRRVGAARRVRSLDALPAPKIVHAGAPQPKIVHALITHV